MADVKITWLGHATFLLEQGDNKILIDPWLAGNPSCPEAYHDVKPDLVLITHGHNDHIGNVFDVAKNSDAKFFGIFDLTTWLGSKGIAEDRLVGSNRGGTVRFDELGLAVTMTDARHSSSFTDEDGNVIYLGEACGLVISFDEGPAIYHAGDTCLFSDMEWIGEFWAPDIAILPIGDHFTMDPLQAAHAAALVDVETVIPCHYGTFPLLTGTPQALEFAIEDLGLQEEIEVVTLEPGSSWTA